jgi:hypothetical protein
MDRRLKMGGNQQLITVATSLRRSVQRAFFGHLLPVQQPAKMQPAANRKNVITAKH